MIKMKDQDEVEGVDEESLDEEDRL